MFKLTELGKVLITKFDLNSLKDEQINIVRALNDNNNEPINFNPYDSNIKSLVRKGIVIYG